MRCDHHALHLSYPAGGIDTANNVPTRQRRYIAFCFAWFFFGIYKLVGDIDGCFAVPTLLHESMPYFVFITGTCIKISTIRNKFRFRYTV